MTRALLLLVVVVNCATLHADALLTLPTTNQIDIICVGDSIVWGDGHGWPEELAKMGTLKVMNAGQNSDTSYGVYRRIKELVKVKPKYMIIQVGTNDQDYSWISNAACKLPFVRHRDGYSAFLFEPITIADYQNFVESIYRLCRKNGIEAIFTTLSSNPQEPRYKFYNDILLAYPKTVQIKLTPEHFTDGIHLSTSGYYEFARQVFPRVKQ